MDLERRLNEVIDALDSVKRIEGFEILKEGDPSILDEDHSNIKNLSPHDSKTVKSAIQLTRQFLLDFSNGEPGEDCESFQEPIAELDQRGYTTSFQQFQYDRTKYDGSVKIENISFDLSGF